jgi:hypothetical protein
MLRQRSQYRVASNGTIRRDIRNHTGAPNSGKQVAEIRQDGLAAAQGQLQHAPVSQPLYQVLPQLRFRTDRACRPTLGITKGAFKIAAVRQGPVGKQGSTQPVRRAGKIIRPTIRRQNGSIEGDSANKTALLEAPEKGDQLRSSAMIAQVLRRAEVSQPLLLQLRALRLGPNRPPPSASQAFVGRIYRNCRKFPAQALSASDPVSFSALPL